MDTGGGGFFVMILLELASEPKIEVSQRVHLRVKGPHWDKYLPHRAGIFLDGVLLDLAAALYQESSVDEVGKYFKDWNRVMDMGEIRTDPDPGSELGTFSPGGIFRSDSGGLDAVFYCLVCSTLLR